MRPKSATYEIGHNCNLDISLFERIAVSRENEHCQLQYQHRMRPEIAKLLTPSIYEKLYNNDSVLKHPHVKGVMRDLYFINHDNREFPSPKNEESYHNVHEAEYFAAFANYLLQQGYQTRDITVLTPYSGQLFTLKEVYQRRVFYFNYPIIPKIL